MNHTRKRQLTQNLQPLSALSPDAPSRTFPKTSGKVETIEVHHFGPRCREVFHKLLLGVRAGMTFVVARLTNLPPGVGVHEFNRENSQARTRCQRHRSLIVIDALTIPCVRHPVAEKPLLKKV
jgi:hypothetical protein